MVDGIQASPSPVHLAARLARALLTVLRAAIAALVIALFAYMTVAVLAQVIGRYVFNFSIDWAVESATFAQIWMVLLGAGYAMRKGLHVSVDFLVAKLPATVVRPLNVAITVLCLWFMWVVFDGSLGLIRIGALQTSSALQLPMNYPYLAIPVAMAYLALEFVLLMWARSFDAGAPGDTETAMP